jgi:hypothetical protein
LSAKLAQTFVDRGVLRGQRDGSPWPYYWLSRPIGRAELGKPKVCITKKRPHSLLSAKECAVQEGALEQATSKADSSALQKLLDSTQTAKLCKVLWKL